MNISDILELESRTEKKKEKFFIVTRFDAESVQELRDLLMESNLKKNYAGFNEIVCQDCSDGEGGKNKVIAFRLKKFNEKKH